MEPIVTLPYSEWLVAEQLMRTLPPRQGYSIYVPASRQEKGVDLLVAYRAKGKTRCATLQVKYSRAYEQSRGQFKFGTLFRSFPVREQADFFALASLYPNITGRGDTATSNRWLPLLLLFRRDEMSQFLSRLCTKSGAPERMFYLAFDSPSKVVLTRGAREERDFTTYTFSERIGILKKHLGAA
jgi:hypothetical protein